MCGSHTRCIVTTLLVPSVPLDLAAFREVVRGLQGSFADFVDISCFLGLLRIDDALYRARTHVRTHAHNNNNYNIIINTNIQQEYVKDKACMYDVVICDSSDPIGPAASLFTQDFYRGLKAAMKPGGVMCNQGECLWLHLDLIGECMSHCAAVWSSVRNCGLQITFPAFTKGSCVRSLYLIYVRSVSMLMHAVC